MNRKQCCLASIILAGVTTSAFAGPYTIENGHVVMMGPDYQTTIPIGNGPHDVDAIEFSVDGFIYGVDWDSDTLVKIDPVTGFSETVGPLGIDLSPGNLDLDEDVEGQLRMHAWQPSGLYTLDRETGAALLSCEPDFPWTLGLVSDNGTLLTASDLQDPPNPGCGLEYVDPTGIYISNLDMGPDGWIHTVYGTSGWWTYATSFDRIDPATGAVEHLGSFTADHGLYGLTFDPTEQPTPAPIPALGWPGQAVFTLLLAFAGVAILTRFWTTRG